MKTENEVPEPLPPTGYFQQIGTFAYVFSLSVLVIYHNKIGSFLALVPERAFLEFELWRTISFALASSNFVRLIIDLVTIFLWSSAVERSRGSVNFVVRVLLTSFLLSLVEGLIYGILLIFSPHYATFIVSSGFFKVYLVEVSALCFSKPCESNRICGLPFKIKNFILPFIILLVEFLYSGNIHDFTCIVTGLIESSLLMMLNCADTDTAYPKLASIFKILRIGTFYEPQQKPRVGPVIRTIAMYDIERDRQMARNSSGMKSLDDIKFDDVSNL